MQEYLLTPSESAVSTQSFNVDIVEHQLFYGLLIQELSLWDVLPFIGTVGANLTQNCYFLIENSRLLCKSNHTCTNTLSIIFCAIDIWASGTQNTFQRFWKSLVWAWITHLKPPTAKFIRALRGFFEDKNKEEAFTLIIHMPSQTYDQIAADPLFITAMALMTSHRKQLTIQFYSDDMEMPNSTITHHLYYNPDKLDYTQPNTVHIVPLTLITYFNLESIPAFIESVLKYIFLVAAPLGMFMFQTISMLSNILPNNLPSNVIACVAGAFFGYGKHIVNNTLRREMANKNWKDLKQKKFYQQSAFYLAKQFYCFFLGMSQLSPATYKTGLKNMGTATLRLSGILIGLSICLFYLDVGLLTKKGIEFTLNTILRLCGTNSNIALKEYHQAHVGIDTVCAVSSLVFNAALTQMRESINKCDQLSTKIENWMDGKPTETTNTSPTPTWVHTANLIDIIVFFLSAWYAINNLFHRLHAIDSPGWGWVRKVSEVAITYHIPFILACFAAISNLIFTYTAAAQDQWPAWRMLRKKLLGGEPSTEESADNRLTNASTTSNASLSFFSSSSFSGALALRTVLEDNMPAAKK